MACAADLDIAPHLKVYLNMDKKTSAPSVIGQAAAESQIVLIEDIHNETQRWEEMLQSLPAMAHSGVKHLFLESPAYMQPALDRLQDGKINFDEFGAEVREINAKRGVPTPHWDHKAEKQQKEEFEHFITDAKKAGIRVHYVDEPPEIARTDPHTKEYLGIGVRYSERIAQIGIDGAWKETMAELTKRFGDHGVKDFIDFNTTLHEQRLAENGRVAETIHHIARSEKSVVFYGAAHIEPEKEHFPAEQGLGRLLNQMGHSTEIVDRDAHGSWHQKEILPLRSSCGITIPQELQALVNAVAESVKAHFSVFVPQGMDMGFHHSMSAPALANSGGKSASSLSM